MRRECYWMISKYVKEQKRYTQDELRKIFECTADETVQIIRKLKEYGIVKNVKKSDRQSMLSDLVEEDIRVTDIESGERELYYVFSFVGVIVVYGRVLKCYPKYINSCGSPVAQMKQIMRVLEKYNSKEQVIKLYNESDDGGSFNLLAVMLYLLQDYYDNGIYANDVDIVETNGTGEILWDRTINETFSYISNNRPYYTELQTKKRTSDEYDFIRRLHACILTKFSKELEESDLPELFNIVTVELSEEQLEDLGDEDYILYRIQNELNVQYNTTLPTYICAFDKKEFVSKPQELLNNLSVKLVEQNMINFLIEWENESISVASNMVRLLLYGLRIEMTNSALQDIFIKMAQLEDSYVNDKKEATRNILQILVEFLRDRYLEIISNEQLINRLAENWGSDFEEKKKESKEISIEQKGCINSLFNINLYDDVDRKLPGKVYIIYP